MFGKFQSYKLNQKRTRVESQAALPRAVAFKTAN